MAYGCYCCSIITSVFSLIVAVALLNISVMYLMEVARYSKPDSFDIDKYCESDNRTRSLDSDTFLKQIKILPAVTTFPDSSPDSATTQGFIQNQNQENSKRSSADLLRIGGFGNGTQVDICVQESWNTGLAVGGIILGILQIFVAGFCPVCIENVWEFWVIFHIFFFAGAVTILSLYFVYVKDPLETTYRNATNLPFLQEYAFNYAKRGYTITIVFLIILIMNSIYTVMGIIIMVAAYSCRHPEENDINWG